MIILHVFGAPEEERAAREELQTANFVGVYTNPSQMEALKLLSVSEYAKNQIKLAIIKGLNIITGNQKEAAAAEALINLYNDDQPPIYNKFVSTFSKISNKDSNQYIQLKACFDLGQQLHLLGLQLINANIETEKTLLKLAEGKFDEVLPNIRILMSSKDVIPAIIDGLNHYTR